MLNISHPYILVQVKQLETGRMMNGFDIPEDIKRQLALRLNVDESAINSMGLVSEPQEVPLDAPTAGDSLDHGPMESNDPLDTPLVDYRQFRRARKKSWETLYNSDLSHAQNVMEILGRATVFPNHDVVAPIATAYALVPSAMAEVLPVLIYCGESGSGKSTGMILSSRVTGLGDYIQGANSTYASLRNLVNRLRWVSQEYNFERHYCLYWDDINRSYFRDKPEIFSMFKSGYNRATGKISIASKDKAGTNMEFDCFGPKITSTVDAFWLDPGFSELLRRVIVIPTKKWDSFTQHEKNVALEHLGEDFSIDKKLNLQSYDWSGFEQKFRDTWNDPANCETYAHLASDLISCQGFSHGLASERWEICVDLVASGITTGVWNSIDSAIECLGKYWADFDSNASESTRAITLVLGQFLAKKTESAEALRQQYGAKIPITIPTKEVKEHLHWARDQGMLDVELTTRNVTDAMKDLGFALKMHQGLVHWVKD
ncbi:MAG TPA: hypothetical protein V6C65_18865 [Allocoleopsis sp.]